MKPHIYKLDGVWYCRSNGLDVCQLTTNSVMLEDVYKHWLCLYEVECYHMLKQ